MKLIDATQLIEDLQYDLENDVNMYNSHLDKTIRDEKYEFAIDITKNTPKAFDLKRLIENIKDEINKCTIAPTEHTIGMYDAYTYVIDLINKQLEDAE